MEKLKITVSRHIAGDLERKIRELGGDFDLDERNKRNLEGLGEVVTVVASLSTIAANTFMIWVSSKKSSEGEKSINVESKEVKNEP